MNEPVEAQQKLTEDIAKGHEAELVGSVLSDAFEHRRKAIIQDVFGVLGSPGSTLDAKKAIQAWLEMYEIHRLEAHLRKRVQAGQAASKRLRDDLEGPGGPAVKPGRSRFLHA